MNSRKRNCSIGTATVAVLGITALTYTSVAVSGEHEHEREHEHARKAAGRYLTGDFHNHTTCSDGSLSVQKLVKKSTDTFGLDWFVQVGHGGSSARNCTLLEQPLEDPNYPAGGQPASDQMGPNQLWTNTVGNAAIKGDVNGPDTARRMWKWQEIQDYMYPVIEQESRARNKPLFMGLEQNVPGHEHTSSSVIDGQLPRRGAGNADAMAMFEYCFDRSDGDTSRGNFVGSTGPNNWDCSVPGSALNAQLDATALKLMGTYNTGVDGHLKSLEGVKWMAAKFPRASFYIPAHVERAGVFDPNASRGFDVNHFRDYNNAAPTVAFGFETMPGHQPQLGRGGYGRGAAGGGTYGGTGAYGALIGGMWDALLGEGRNWFFFASSDYHNRGSFGPDVGPTTGDFYPGEYTRDFVMVRGGGKATPGTVVDGLRTGNSFVANGGLIDRLAFVACAAPRGEGGDHKDHRIEDAAVRAVLGNTDVDVEGCATMGEKLRVRPGTDVVVTIAVRDPQGTNFAPYAFPNPSLKQIGIEQPLNAPVLDHIDVIGGLVTGYVDPSNTAAYAGPIGSPAATNPSAALKRTFNVSNWKSHRNGVRVMSYRIPAVQASQYLRLRGTNLPAAVPYETDAQGNPLLDFDAVDNVIPCGSIDCPDHMNVVNGVKASSYDVAAWADLWFYSNPVFIEVKGSYAVAGIK